MENGKVPFHEPWKMDFPGAHSRATSVCHVMSLVGDMMFIKENSTIMNKHFHHITGQRRILPLVYPAGDEVADGDGDDDDSVVDVGA